MRPGGTPAGHKVNARCARFPRSALDVVKPGFFSAIAGKRRVRATGRCSTTGRHHVAASRPTCVPTQGYGNDCRTS